MYSADVYRRQFEDNSYISLLVAETARVWQRCRTAGWIVYCPPKVITVGMLNMVWGYRGIWEIPAGFVQETHLPAWTGPCVCPAHSRLLSLGQLSCSDLWKAEFLGKWTGTAQLGVKSLALYNTGGTLPAPETDGVNSGPASALQILSGTAAPISSAAATHWLIATSDYSTVWPSTVHRECPCPPFPPAHGCFPKGQRAESCGVGDKCSSCSCSQTAWDWKRSGLPLLGRWKGNFGVKSSWLFMGLGYAQCCMNPSALWGQSILPLDNMQDSPIELPPRHIQVLPALSFHPCTTYFHRSVRSPCVRITTWTKQPRRSTMTCPHHDTPHHSESCQLSPEDSFLHCFSEKMRASPPFWSVFYRYNIHL